MRGYDVNVVRDGKFWLIEIPELERSTQARSIREIDAMARDLIQVMTDQPAGPEDLELRVLLQLPDSTQKQLRLYQEHTEAAKREARDATAAHRAAARDLSTHGLTYRDIGAALGVSHQRAEQLVKAV